VIETRVALGKFADGVDQQELLRVVSCIEVGDPRVYILSNTFPDGATEFQVRNTLVLAVNFDFVLDIDFSKHNVTNAVLAGGVASLKSSYRRWAEDSGTRYAIEVDDFFDRPDELRLRIAELVFPSLRRRWKARFLSYNGARVKYYVGYSVMQHIGSDTWGEICDMMADYFRIAAAFVRADLYNHFQSDTALPYVVLTHNFHEVYPGSGSTVEGHVATDFHVESFGHSPAVVAALALRRALARRDAGTLAKKDVSLKAFGDAVWHILLRECTGEKFPRHCPLDFWTSHTPGSSVDATETEPTRVGPQEQPETDTTIPPLNDDDDQDD
jgi:hypothetical protein